MKVLVVGTGSISSMNNSPSYIIDDDIIIDMPNGNYKHIKQLGIVPESINNILLTHHHGDHFFDMPFFIFETLKNKKTYNIYVDSKGIKLIKKITKLAFPFTYYNLLTTKYINYNTKEVFTINNKDIEKVNVKHGILAHAYGYIIADKNVCVGFTGDATICQNVEYMAKTCKYLFCDCTYEKGDLNHMGINNIEYLAKEYPNCTLIVTHMSDKTKDKLLKSKLKNIIVPNDGDEFDF